MRVSPDAFRFLSQGIVGGGFTETKFKAHVGVSPEVTFQTWELITRKPKHSKPKHLLWALLFAKLYSTEEVLAGMVGVTRKTFRKWSWKFLKKIAMLKSIVVRGMFVG
jgi:hypothetical protein